MTEAAAHAQLVKMEQGHVTEMSVDRIVSTAIPSHLHCLKTTPTPSDDHDCLPQHGQ